MNQNIVFRLSFIFALVLFFILLTGLQDGQIAQGTEAQDSSDTDAIITSAIKVKFANDEVVSASSIHVDTSEGSVKLMGSVISKAVADRAVYLGRSVDGVKTVHSLLVVRPR